MAATERSVLNQYLTFTLSEELFALDIAWVKEILSDVKITKIPRMPHFIMGVINVRGHAMPVINLHRKFGMPDAPLTNETCVIITEINLDNEIVVIGALADTVQEVMELKPDQIDPPPKMGAAIDTRFMKGFGKHNDAFIIILDINGVFSDEDIEALQMAGDYASGEKAERAEAMEA
jgi:purine-binding chemotaxis protein CheW